MEHVLTALTMRELVQMGNHADLMNAHQLSNYSSVGLVKNVDHI